MDGGKVSRRLSPKPPENRTRWRMSCYRCGEHQETRPYGPGGALVCIWCATSTAKDESATRAAFGARLTNAPQVLTEAGPQAMPQKLTRPGRN